MDRRPSDGRLSICQSMKLDARPTATKNKKEDERSDKRKPRKNRKPNKRTKKETESEEKEEEDPCTEDLQREPSHRILGSTLTKLDKREKAVIN